MLFDGNRTTISLTQWLQNCLDGRVADWLQNRLAGFPVFHSTKPARRFRSVEDRLVTEIASTLNTQKHTYSYKYADRRTVSTS